jgi:uncharacterized protein (TIGR02466 family)
MKSLNPFPEPLWKSKFPGRLDTIIKKIDAFALDKDVTTKELGGKSLQRYNFKDNPHEWGELEQFNIWVGPFIEKVWKNWGCQLEEWQDLRFKSWVNYNDFGQHTGEHTHPNDVLTIVFYIAKPKDTAELQILDPLLYHWGNTPVGTNNTVFWRDVPAEVGEVVIFPGWMLHRVDINESKEQRISITINIHIITKDGN